MVVRQPCPLMLPMVSQMQAHMWATNKINTSSLRSWIKQDIFFVTCTLSYSFLTSVVTSFILKIQVKQAKLIIINPFVFFWKNSTKTAKIRGNIPTQSTKNFSWKYFFAISHFSVRATPLRKETVFKLRTISSNIIYTIVSANGLGITSTRGI